MKIRSVHAHVLRAKLSQPFSYSRAWYDERYSTIVEVTSEDGIVGFGEVYGPARMTAPVVQIMGEMLVGSDGSAVEAIWQRLYSTLRDHGQKGLVVQALSGIDIALWDLKGKTLGRPVHELLGGPLRTSVQAYATGLYRRREGKLAEYLVEEALQYEARGFAAVKLKIGWDWREDVAITQSLRKALRPGTALMVDANHAWDVVSALAYGHAVADLNLDWFEEPVPPEERRGYRHLRDRLNMPIAGGECEFTRFGFRDLFLDCALDIAQPDTCAAGGITECKKISDLACAFGVRFIPHCWGTGIAQAAALQLLALAPDTPLSLAPAPHWLEMDQTQHPIRDALTPGAIAVERGIVQIPASPGLGVEVDREALKHFAA